MEILQTVQGGIMLWLSEVDTCTWAGQWSLSTIRGSNLFVEFDSKGNLIDLLVNNGIGDQECNDDEIRAITTDYIAIKFPKHPALRGNPQPIPKRNGEQAD